MPIRVLPLTQLELEREVVGACIDNAEALRIALRTLPRQPFCSEERYFLDGLYFTICGWASRGRYNAATNRDVLEDRLSGLVWPLEMLSHASQHGLKFKKNPTIPVTAEATIIANLERLDACWCRAPSVPGYVTQLCRQAAFPNPFRSN